MMKTAHSFKTKNKGQSFIELALLMSTLLLLVVGLIEFGNMLNQYINLVDGAREGARFGSNTDPFYNVTTRTYDYSGPQKSFFDDIDKVIEGNTSVNPTLRTSAITPLFLDRAPEDLGGSRSPTNETYQRAEVIITFYSVSNGAIVKKWSTNIYQTGRVSQISDAEVASHLNAAAPNTGILLVEIFYNYFQLLKLPFFTYVVADPVPLHAYAFMPLAAAESTPTPP